MLLSNSFWRRRFHSDPNVVLQKLTLNHQPVMVVGVLPASFDFASVFAPGTPIDIFIPWPLADKTEPAGNTMAVVGRLKPGATAVSAQAELTVLAKQLVSQYPERNPIFPKVVPLERHVSGQVRPAVMLLMCAVGVIMLIVCANLAHLQMARMGTRQKEMAVRAALGARRFRLLRQVLTESVVLSCCGAARGLLLAVAGTRALANLNTFNLPLLASVRVDGGTLAFTSLAAVTTGILFGLALGTLGSFAFSKWMGSLLFGTTPANPAVFSGVGLLLCAVALVAAYVPARRASRIEPSQALRTE